MASIYLGLKSKYRRRPLVEQRAAQRPGQAVRGRDGTQYVSIQPVIATSEARHG